MAAANNPYYIEPANPLSGLMQFDQSYQQARQQKLQDQMQVGRVEAARALQSGADTKEVIGKLFSVGDVQAAHAVAQYDLARQQQANTQAFHESTLRLQGDTLAETK